MPLAITDDHTALAEVARAFLAGQRAAARGLLDQADEPLPAFWKELASLGWLGLAVPEGVRGQGGRPR
jgi:alkylation response protein AidB-like acyl-CoA dehydrogenase